MWLQQQQLSLCPTKYRLYDNLALKKQGINFQVQKECASDTRLKCKKPIKMKHHFEKIWYNMKCPEETPDFCS